MERRIILLWTAVALVGVDLVFFSGASNFLAAPQSRILNQLLVVAVAAGLGVAALRGAADLRSPLVLPGLVWVAVNVVSTITASRPAASVEGLALLLIAAPGYLAVRAVTCSRHLRPRLDRLVVAATVAFMLAYLAQAGSQWVAWWSVAGLTVPPLRPGDVGLTVGTVNAVALYLELLAPVAVWLAWTTWRRRVPAILVAATAVVALVITGSRGAWLGSLVAAAAMLSVAWVVRGRPLPALPARRRTRAVAVAGLVVMIGGVAVLGPALLTRLLSGDAGRIELWTAAWSIFTAHPLTGGGPGAFSQLRPETLISEANLAVLTTSHNSVLQTLAETGIAGLLAAGWIVVAVARQAARAIRMATTRDDRILRGVAATALLAMAVHSLVDTQFHLPAVMLMVFLLVARLDPAQSAGGAVIPDADTGPGASDPRVRARVAAAALGVLTGAVILVPVDVAMVRAAMGNVALARGDAAAALADFRAAAALHELAPYRVGEGVAAAALGDRVAAEAALARAENLQALSFITASRAVVADAGARGALVARVEAGGGYDPAAIVEAAVLRFPDDPARATDDLAAAMAGVPTLVYSTRPTAIFDDATWTVARRRAIDAIGAGDPVLAAALGMLAGEPDLAARYRGALPAGPDAEALDLLAGAVAGRPDVQRARALLREAPASASVQGVLWLLGFRALSQPMLDDVRALSVPQFFGLPLPPMELVTDGRPDTDASIRLPRWPMASDARHGPTRPYPLGMVTIEPVFRPKP